MEKKLLSAEENKDVVYEFDAFVTQSPLDNSNDTLQMQAVEEISQELKKKNLQILSEKDCLGQDWLETLKFAATKCRWVVLLDKKQGSPTQEKGWFDKLSKSKWSESKTLMPFTIAAALKSILESRKVQTVAVVNKSDELHINDDLRWVTCIPYSDITKDIVDTLFKVLSGSDVELDNSADLYLRPGEAAVGLAWGYAVNYLNKVLPEVKRKRAEIMKEHRNINFEEKLFIVVPESCKTEANLKGVNKLTDTTPAKGSKRSYQLTAYQLHDDENTCFFGQYAPPVDVIYQMKEANIISEKQMKTEVIKFYTTVEKIMEILLKGKQKDFEFVYYNDKNDKLADVMSERIQ